jgi:hypothetical protein
MNFWEHVNKTDGCWLWTAGKTGVGYGTFIIDGKSVGAHRHSYALHYGPIPPGMLVCHRCDNPLCVRPDHLFLGSHLDNMRDMAAKGRKVTRRGDESPLAKLSDAEVREVRSLVEDGFRQADVARHYSISQAMVSHIVTGRRKFFLG